MTRDGDVIGNPRLKVPGINRYANEQTLIETPLLNLNFRQSGYCRDLLGSPHSSDGGTTTMTIMLTAGIQEISRSVGLEIHIT